MKNKVSLFNVVVVLLKASSATLTIVWLLQQSFSWRVVHSFEDFLTISSLQTLALPKIAKSTNLLQQKCISTVKEEVENSIVTAIRNDNILVENFFKILK